MQGYRLFFTNAAGNILSALEFEAADDRAAIALARSKGTSPMELWQLARVVKRFPAADPHADFGPALRPYRLPEDDLCAVRA